MRVVCSQYTGATAFSAPVHHTRLTIALAIDVFTLFPQTVLKRFSVSFSYIYICVYTPSSPQRPSRLRYPINFSLGGDRNSTLPDSCGHATKVNCGFFSLNDLFIIVYNPSITELFFHTKVLHLLISDRYWITIIHIILNVKHAYSDIF
jgi:hypothetical protein